MSTINCSYIVPLAALVADEEVKRVYIVKAITECLDWEMPFVVVSIDTYVEFSVQINDIFQDGTLELVRAGVRYELIQGPTSLCIRSDSTLALLTAGPRIPSVVLLNKGDSLTMNSDTCYTLLMKSSTLT